MSWTIEKTTEYLREGNALARQLEEAENNKIVMFCSSSDQGILSSGEFYPHASKKCIKIGAATEDGYGCSFLDKEVDFLFPGKNIPFKWERSDEETSTWSESGSSFATALAAGLGAILLYAYRAFNDAQRFARPTNLERQDGSNAPADPSNDSFEIWDMKTKETMTNMIKNLSESEPPYVRADRWFGRHFLRHISGSTLNVTDPESAEAMERLAADESAAAASIPELPWNEKTRAGLWRLLKEIRKANSS